MTRLGARVKVRIKQPDRFAQGAAESLEGVTGRVLTIGARMVLVRFDAPARTWWAQQSPITAFWFDAGDLEVLS